MATHVYEEAFDLSVGLLEATLPAEPLAGVGLTSYPYPSLRPMGQSEVRTFAVAVLENDFLKVAVAPALGGRVVSLFDKRTNTEILRRHPSVDPQVGGLRGVVLREGIQIRLNAEDRLNSMGPTAASLVVPEGESEPGAVWIAEAGAGSPVSFHFRYELPPDRAELKVSVRAQNRSMLPVEYDAGLALYLGEGRLSNRAWYSEERKAGVAISGEDLEVFLAENGILSARRFGRKRYLSARQVDSWSAVITPISGLRTLTVGGEAGGISLAEDALTVQASSDRPGHMLYLLTEDGQTLEAPAELQVASTLVIPLQGLPAKARAVRLRDPQKQDVLATDLMQIALFAKGDDPQPSGWDPTTASESDLRDALFDVGKRGTAATVLGQRALAEGDFEAADRLFEIALSYNAEDPLLWWAKAITQRKLHPEATERPELLNAHYLAPLEPALRAEAFLGQEPSPEKDPNPLLAPLEETSEAFVEVACMLLEWGLYQEAHRWLDEALRHGEQIMLHYLQAFCYLKGSHMDAQAAEHVASAKKMALTPPFPWRRIEADALSVLLRRFPNEPRLEQFEKFVRSRNISLSTT